MSIDEVIRVGCYAILAPGFFYLGIVARNRRECLLLALAWGLSAFFILLLVGLVLLRMDAVYYPLVYINTGVVFLLAVLVVRLCYEFLGMAWAERKHTKGIP
jgi:hypothetical protein